MSVQRHTISIYGGNAGDETFHRYREMREGARQRIGCKELENWEFISLLLDVYDLHLGDAGVTRGP